MRQNEVLNERNTIECSICLGKKTEFSSRYRKAVVHTFSIEDINPVHGILECKHIFCYRCIKPWVDQNHRCPNCNYPSNSLVKCRNVFPIPSTIDIWKYFGIDYVIHSKVESDDYNKRPPRMCEALGKPQKGWGVDG